VRARRRPPRDSPNPGIRGIDYEDEEEEEEEE